LERAFHRQRQFTDDASHELRSPLAVIEAEATLALRRQRPAEEYRDALSTISEEAITMNLLIDQLLTLARGDAGAEAIDYQQIDLSKLIVETIGVMQPLAEEKRLKLSVKSSPVQGNLGMLVTGDETQLKRVLTNLIENAIRHTESDGEISVLVERHDSLIEWRISDTGCGISEEHLPHVFERFYRADKARSRQNGGSGLGLAICRLIVEAHHGVISVESELGEGTTFLIQLPSI
jgi:signal transduction histidine kinase